MAFIGRSWVTRCPLSDLRLGSPERQNATHGNTQLGFFGENGTGHVLTGASTVGNEGDRIDTAVNAGATITKSNIYGSKGFGVFNGSGAIDATNNSWGAATDPGADPADGIFDDAVGSITSFIPFAIMEFTVKVKAGG